LDQAKAYKKCMPYSGQGWWLKGSWQVGRVEHRIVSYWVGKGLVRFGMPISAGREEMRIPPDNLRCEDMGGMQ
jgi:hypothetical protein